MEIFSCKSNIYQFWSITHTCKFRCFAKYLQEEDVQQIQYLPVLKQCKNICRSVLDKYLQEGTFGLSTLRSAWPTQPWLRRIIILPGICPFYCEETISSQALSCGCILWPNVCCHFTLGDSSKWQTYRCNSSSTFAKEQGFRVTFWDHLAHHQ